MHYLKFFKKIEEIPKQISIKMESFEKEAQDLGIHAFEEFYDSKPFKNKHRVVDKNIICDLD